MVFLYFQECLAKYFAYSSTHECPALHLLKPTAFVKEHILLPSQGNPGDLAPSCSLACSLPSLGLCSFLFSMRMFYEPAPDSLWVTAGLAFLVLAALHWTPRLSLATALEREVCGQGGKSSKRNVFCRFWSELCDFLDSPRERDVCSPSSRGLWGRGVLTGPATECTHLLSLPNCAGGGRQAPGGGRRWDSGPAWSLSYSFLQEATGFSSDVR